MKILKIILGTFLVCTIFAFTTETDKVPEKVKDAFAKKFPTAKKVKWEKENATEWEADFKMNKVEYSANFLDDGTWIETEHEIEKTEVPQNINTVLKKEFPGYEMEEAEISETEEGIFYEIEIAKEDVEIEIVFDANANVIKEKINKVDEDDDDNDKD